jgi:amidase
LARIEAIDQAGPQLRSIIELNPAALTIAAELDAERAATGSRGPLHGIPILLKDNIDTADQMLTTAGSLSLVGSRPTQDATVAKKLREAGVVLLGKTNLSEWANFRSTRSTSGWSARGGQTRNPYVLDRNPCGSSSGSAVAAAANLAAVTLGTETDGSIVCPASANGVVGLKPSVGLTSRAGLIPISHSQDTVGPIARTVADAAVVLGALTGVDARDPATGASADNFSGDYTQFLELEGLRGARIGVPREVYFGYNTEVDQIIETALATMQAAGALIIDPADIPTALDMKNGAGEFEVLLYEFKANLNQYLASRVPNTNDPELPQPRSLADIIAPFSSRRSFTLQKQKDR